MLTWNYDEAGMWAASCMHDDGDPYRYEFEKSAAGYENLTPAELIHGPCDAVFATAEAAKAWAERTEAKWRASKD